VILDVDVAVVGDVEDDWGDVLPLVNSTLGWYSLLTAPPSWPKQRAGPRDPPSGGTAGRVV
jgi:hypothetical protein